MTTSVRSEALHALRLLLLTVDGVPDPWKIYSANRTYEKDDQPQQGDTFLEENALGDDTTDTANGGASGAGVPVGDDTPRLAGRASATSRTSPPITRCSLDRSNAPTS